MSALERVMRSERFVARLVVAMAIPVASCHGPTEATQQPGASILIYSQRAQGTGLYLISTDGRRVTPVSAPGLSVPAPTHDFDWSPDGARIAFFDGLQLFVVGIRGGKPLQLTSGPSDSRFPNWSPDGSMLEYREIDVGGATWGLNVIRPDGSGKRRLPGTEFASGMRASWSPDGRRIVFAKDEIRYNPVLSQYDWTTSLFVADLNSETAVRLTTAGTCGDRDPAWSPDGTVIAFVGCRDAIRGIYLMGVDGSGLRRVTSAIDNPDFCPTWSPSGDRLAFERGPLENRDVFTVALDGSDLVNLTTSNQEYDGVPRWRKR
jgi:Tol biopolymer transport system component